MKTLIVLLFLFATLLIAPSPARDVVRGQFPRRPADAAAIGIAAGVFENYALHTEHGDVYLTLALRESQLNRDRTFYLAQHTVLNGLPLECQYNGPLTDYSNSIASWQLCSSLPVSVVAGRSTIAVLWWRAPLFIHQTMDATDSLVVLAMPELLH